MPIYEYFCPQNRRIYSFFARSLRYADKTPRCPENPKWKMEKMLSGFAITGRAKEETPGTDEDLDDSKMEAAMDAMEREFGSVADSDNPDPRALAAMMRRMGEITGQKMPPEMGEVIARLEKGEDPDKLEEEYGDVFEKMEGMGEEGGDGEAQTEGRGKLRRKRRITRDPKLYEMSEFVDAE
jgi:hypothetical protein